MEEIQQKKLCSVALLAVSDGHFVNSGVAKSRSHLKGEGYLTLQGDGPFSKHKNNANPFTAYFQFLSLADVRVTPLEKEGDVEHLLDCNFKSSIPVLGEFPKSALPVSAVFLSLLS